MSKDKLIAIYEKQKLVDGIIKKQSSLHADRIESVVLKQHDAELLKYIDSQSSNEIAFALEELDIELAQWVWTRIPFKRQNEILWELSDERRGLLAEGREPDFEQSKVSVFELQDGRLKQVTVQSRNDLDNLKPIWIDLLNTSKAERAFIGSHFNIELPDPLEETELEVSSRFFISTNNLLDTKLSYSDNCKSLKNGINFFIDKSTKSDMVFPPT